MMVPQNLYNTISSTSFTQYMGIGNYDLRADIQQTDNISEKRLNCKMRWRPAISKVAVLTTKAFNIKTEDGSEENIKSNSATIPYSRLLIPLAEHPAEDEIALSAINADELGKKVGDVITLVIEGQEKELTVSGIYSDITNGGKTAKAVFSDNSADMMWSIICAELSDISLIGAKISDYADRFDFAKISDIDEFITQTFGSTINAVKKASDAQLLLR